MKILRNKILAALIIGLCSKELLSGVVGSNTSVLRAGLTVFTSNDATNEMRGFTSFDAGVTIPNATTFCLYNAFFPLNGPLTLNGGAINLNEDLSFASGATLVNGGVLNGNGHTISLPPVNGSLTLNGMIFNNTSIVVNSNIILNDVMRFNGTCILSGQGNTIDCTRGSIVVGAGGSLLIENATLSHVQTGRLLCADSAGTFSFSNTTIIQDSTYSFTQGRIIVLNSLVMTGSALFVYQSSAASTIASEATWFFDDGMSFSYVPPINARNLIGMTDATSILSFDVTTLYSTPTGLQLTKGTLRLNGTCTIKSDAKVAAEAIMFGDGVNNANDLLIDLLAESGFNLVSGLIAYNNVAG